MSQTNYEIENIMFKAHKNLVNFRNIVLINSDDDEVAPAPFHFKWSDELLNGSKNKAVEGFRESAKTQYVIRSFMLYCLTFPSRKRDYIAIIKKNATLARNKLKEVEREYMSNPLLNANLVRINEMSGDVFDLDLKLNDKENINVRLEAYGKGSAIRGLSSIDRRPKIVIIDDPQDIEDASSETVQENDWNWFLSDVKFLGKYARIFMIGNNLGEKCIIERVFANPNEVGFEVERMPVLNENGESAWPEKFSVAEILKEKEDFRRIGKLDIWIREKMCQAVSEESRVFSKSDFRYYVATDSYADKLAKAGNVFATLDPASSPNPESCFRAITVNVVNEDNYWHILDVPYGRWNSIELIDKIFDTVKKWKPLKFGIEKGMFKQIIEPFIYKEMTKRNQFFEIVPIEHAKKGSKLERVSMLGPRFKAHSIWFPEHSDWLTELESELLGVTKSGFKSLFTDLADALSMQEQIIDAPLNAEVETRLPRTASTETDLDSYHRMPRQAQMSTGI